MPLMSAHMQTLQKHAHTTMLSKAGDRDVSHSQVTGHGVMSVGKACRGCMRPPDQR